MNNTIAPITLDAAEGKVMEQLSGAKASLGMVPNLFGVYANAPAVLTAYLETNKALAGGVLSGRQREAIALAVAEANRCSYCLSAHSILGKGAGLKPEEITASRHSTSNDPTTQALLDLATTLVKTRGQVTTDELGKARAAGLTDAQVLEVVAHVALNILTNYTNNLVGTVIDFPVVEPATANV